MTQSARLSRPERQKRRLPPKLRPRYAIFTVAATQEAVSRGTAATAGSTAPAGTCVWPGGRGGGHQARTGTSRAVPVTISPPLSPSPALSLSLSVSQLVSFTAGRAEPLCRAAGDIPRRHRLAAGSPTLMGRRRHPGPRDTAVTRRLLQPTEAGGGGVRAVRDSHLLTVPSSELLTRIPLLDADPLSCGFNSDRNTVFGTTIAELQHCKAQPDDTMPSPIS